ncbi:MAG: hypothetical protein N2445_02385 [Acidobacteria bacterium]|nr:hypothetical protein [Acidobacteriota bacterium]
MSYKIASIGIILSFLLLIFACDKLSTPINEIKENPEKYENKTLFVYGKVISSQKISPTEKEGSYIINDGTGEIKVITTKTLPEIGKKVFVKAKVKSNFVLFGKHFGVVLKEE